MSVGSGVAVERVGEIVRPIDEEYGHRRRADVHRRVPEADPFGFVLRIHCGELAEPAAVLVQESASVDGYGGFESVVEPGDDAGEVSAPAYTGDGGLVGFYFGQ